MVAVLGGIVLVFLSFYMLIICLQKPVSVGAKIAESPPEFSSPWGLSPPLRPFSRRLWQQVRWNFRAVDSRKLAVIHSGSDVNPGLASRHAVVGRGRLVIVGVQLADAGTYTCMLPTSAAEISTTELTVIGMDSTPQLSMGPFSMTQPIS